MSGLWDARPAVEAAVQAAGPNQHVLLADLALRLARQGFIQQVSVTVAGGPGVAEAVRQVLGELGAVPTETAPARDAGVRVGNGDSDALDPLPSRNRACPVCGRALRQDARQANTRVFCSTLCRVHHHRAKVGPKAWAPAQGSDSLSDAQAPPCAALLAPAEDGGDDG